MDQHDYIGSLGVPRASMGGEGNFSSYQFIAPSGQSQAQSFAPVGQEGEPTLFRFDGWELTDLWILQTELEIEIERRRTRQIALRRSYIQLQREVFPELRRRTQVVGIPYRANSLGGVGTQRIPPPPPLRRQTASEVFHNGHFSSDPRDGQLRSSHGSITETDDLGWDRLSGQKLGGRSEGLVQGCRYNMSASSSRNSVDVSGKHGAGCGRGIRPHELAMANSVDPSSRSTTPTSSEEASEADPPEYVVIREGVPFAWGPNGYMTMEHGSAMYVTMGQQDRWAEGTMGRRDRAVQADLGVTIVNTQPVSGAEGQGILVDSEGLCCTSFIREGFVVPGYVNYGGVYRHGKKIPYPDWGREARFPFSRLAGKDELWVYLPSVKKLMKKFGACDTQEGVMRSALNDIEREYPSLPNSCKQAAILVLRERLESHAKVIQGSKPRQTPPVLQSNQFVEQFRQAGVCVKYGLYKFQYTTSDMRPSEDALFRRDILEVVESVGGSFVDGQLKWFDEDTRPLKEVLVACTFQGLRSFTYFERNHANQAAAMVRLFKCRGGDRVNDILYSRRQATFVFDLFTPDRSWFGELGRFRLDFADVDLRAPVVQTVSQVLRPLEFSSMSYTMVDTSAGMRPRARVFDRLEDPRHSEIAQWFDPLFAEYRKSEGFLVYVMWCMWIFSGQLANVLARSGGYVCNKVLHGLEYAMIAFISLVDLVLFRLLHSALNHSKRRIRHAIGRMQYGLLRPASVGFMSKRMTAEVKDEPAKPGKPPRAYFSLGLMSSMFGGPWIDVAKKKLYACREVFCGGWKLRTLFLSENSYTAVSGVFNSMWETHVSGRQEVFATIMSDDVGVSTPSGFYNLDISMCDASLGPGVFWLVVLFLRSAWVPEVIIRGLMDQISREVVIQNTLCKYSIIVFKFLSYYLVSGTVLTTLTDTIASLMVVCAFMAAYVFGARDPEQFSSYFAAVGLVVTVEFFRDFHHFSMLKRRPVQIEGRQDWGAPLAVGCLLKRFGYIDVPACRLADLVPKSCVSLEDKCEAFLGAVVEGWKSEPSHPLLDAFKRRFPHVGGRVCLDEEVKDERFSDVINPDRVVVDSLLECYGVDRAAYDEAVSHASELFVGSLSFTLFMTKVMEKDYGL